MPSCTASSGSWTEKGFRLEQPTPTDSKHQETCTHYRELDTRNSYCTPVRGHCYRTLMGWSVITFWHRVLGGCLLLLFLPLSGFTLGSVSGTKQPGGFWSSWISQSSFCTFVSFCGEPSSNAGNRDASGARMSERKWTVPAIPATQNAVLREKGCVAGSRTEWPLMAAFTGAVRMWERWGGLWK